MRPGRPVVELDGVLADVVRAVREGPARTAEAGIDRLATTPAAEVDSTLDEAAGRVLDALFRRGWQPADVDRAAGPALRPLAADLVRARMARYPSDRIADRWAAQVAALPDGPAPGYRHDEIRARVELLATLAYLPDLPLLMPPPGVARTGGSTSTAADARVLGRIRALLAKAESTTFPEEAEAYTAKAQEMITRHRVDRALVAGEVVDQDQPLGVRVTVERPYAEAKATLLHGVAEANGCRAVWSGPDGFTTVFGYADDLAAVELLYVSLLAQGIAAMVREGSARHDAPARTRTFRQSFLHGYAIRIGDRLRSAAASSGGEALGDGVPLPVLVSRDRAVRERVDHVFPYLVSTGRSIRIDSRSGWHNGTAFADRASLDR